MPRPKGIPSKVKTTTVTKMTTKKTGTGKNKVTKLNQNVRLGKGFPHRLVMTHKYTESVAITSTSGVAANFLWSTNGLFDPNITGSGHQPQGFDNLTPLYDHYHVIGSKCSFTITPTTQTDDATIVAAWINDDTSVNVQNVDRQAEQSNKGFQRVIPAGATTVTRFNLKWSARKEFGKGVLANNELRGTSTANPTEQSYFCISVQDLGQGATVQVYCVVSIEYIAVWTELKDQPGQ